MVKAPPIEHALVVEDSPRLQAALRTALQPWAAQVQIAGTVAQALTALAGRPPQLILLDVQLPDGSGHTVARAAQALTPLPIIVALSAVASPVESFALAELGVRGYLQKPFEPDQLHAAIQTAISTPPDLELPARAAVGKLSIHDAETQVREAMVKEALGQASGSKRGAAKLLSVSRQLVQHMVKKIYDRGR